MHFLLVVFEGDEDDLSRVAVQELRRDSRVLEVVSRNFGDDALTIIKECLNCGSLAEQRLVVIRAIRKREPQDLGYLTRADFLAFCSGLATPERAGEIFEELVATAGRSGNLVVQGRKIQIGSFVRYVFQTDILPNGSDALLTELARMLC